MPPRTSPLRKALKMLGYGVAAFLGVVILFVVYAVGYAAYAVHAYSNLQDTHDLPQQIDKLAGAYVAKHKYAGLMVGVLQRDQRFIHGYGKGISSESPPDGDTIYDIGSITKVFTGITLAGLEAEGVIGLDDPLEKHWPHDLPLSESVRPVTLKQLATHTAGFPRLPNNFAAAAKDDTNPYKDYTATDLAEALTSMKVKAPSKQSAYSNFGMGTLGHLLSLKAQQPYEQLVRRFVCEPLMMTDTSITIPEDHQPRVIAGHSPKGQSVPSWEFDVLAPAGAFHSTTNDLLRFLQANLSPPETECGKILQRAQETHFEHWTGSVGLGWQVTKTVEGLNFRWHNGGTGGFVSFIGFDREHQTAVVVLSNSGDAFAGDTSVDHMAMKILTLASKISLAAAP